MKKSTLAMSIAATSATATLLATSSAFAYDVFDFTGTSQLELHSTKAVLPAAPDPDCNPASLCGTDGGSVDGQVFATISVLNKTANAADGSDGPNGPVAAECYKQDTVDYDATTGVDLGTGDGGTVTREIQHLHTPAAAAGYGQAILHNNTSSGVLPNLFDICTDEEGKFTTGWYAFFTNLGPLGQIWAISDYVPATDGLRKSVTFQDGTAGTQFEQTPTITDAQFVVSTLAAGGDPTTSTYGTGWIYGSVATFAYETCDTGAECGQFGKSVPVPAFAAAALGLGLLGVTVLTGRRRQIK